MAEKKIDYTALEKIRTTALESSLQQKLESKQMGNIDSLRHTILSYIVNGNYDIAKSELLRYIDMQKDYPAFASRAEPYINYCMDVIQAIKTKRTFPGLQALPMSKQQELLEKVLDHFEELKHYLQKIERTEKDVKLEDLRSTVWVIKAFVYSVFAVLLFVFIRQAFASMFSSFEYVIDDYSNKTINWLFELIQ